MLTFSSKGTRRVRERNEDKLQIGCEVRSFSLLNEMCVCACKRIYFIVDNHQSSPHVGCQSKRRTISMSAAYGYGLNFILTICSSYTQALAIMMTTMMMTMTTMIQQSRETHPLRQYFITYSLTWQAFAFHTYSIYLSLAYVRMHVCTGIFPHASTC